LQQNASASAQQERLPEAIPQPRSGGLSEDSAGARAEAVTPLSGDGAMQLAHMLTSTIAPQAMHER